MGTQEQEGSEDRQALQIGRMVTWAKPVTRWSKVGGTQGLSGIGVHERQAAVEREESINVSCSHCEPSI